MCLPTRRLRSTSRRPARGAHGSRKTPPVRAHTRAVVQSRVMTENAAKSSAERAQDDANEMGMTADDEHAAKEQLEQTGEPIRDKLGNEDGAS